MILLPWQHKEGREEHVGDLVIFMIANILSQMMDWTLI